MTVIELLAACMNVRNYTTIIIENSSGIIYHGEFSQLRYDLIDNPVITFKLTGEGMKILII